MNNTQKYICSVCFSAVHDPTPREMWTGICEACHARYEKVFRDRSKRTVRKHSR